jgi:anti-sigma B factor antagonist
MNLALQITSHSAPAATVISPVGRLVLGEKTHALRDEVRNLVAKGRKRLVLNMKDVTHIDSAGLGALVAAYHSAHSRGAILRLCHLKPIFKELLQVTGLLHVFQVFDTEEDALHANWPAAMPPGSHG